RRRDDQRMRRMEQKAAKGAKGVTSLCPNMALRLSLVSWLPSVQKAAAAFQLALLIGVAWCALLIGCGDNTSSVSGTVTFDNQPVTSGTITFVKSEGDLVREGAIIKDGTFQAHVPPGNYKIELNAQKVVSKRKQKGFDGT